MLVLVIAPFFTSFLIRTLAWRTILSDDWFVTTWAQNLHITDLLQAVGLTDNDSLLNSQFAVIMGLTYNFLPFMILPLYTSLERLDPRLIEAAGDLYASPWQTFRKVTWPLSLPGVVAGTLLTFIPAAGDFINARLLGNTQTTMIGSVIDSQFLRVLDYPLAAALSFILLILIVAHGLGLRAPSRNGGAALMAWIKRHLIAFAAIAVLIYMLVPNVIVAAFSFNDPKGKYNYNFNEFSTAAWTNPCGAQGICESLGLSLQIGVIASLDGHRCSAR